MAVAVLSIVLARPAFAQVTRESEIVRAKADKAAELRPYQPGAVEAWLEHSEDLLLSGQLHWHPFFESAYAGGGFTLGAGYRRYVSAYNTVDIRGSLTFSGYKRIEAAYLAPRLLDRRAVLSVVGGWREATEVGFYGIGTPETSKDDRVNYAFDQPYLSARLDVRPWRYFIVGGGFEYANWNQQPGGGEAPSVEEVYTAETLPGLGTSPTYMHVQGSAGLDWRRSAGYTRRGGSYGVTVHDFVDHEGSFGFRQVDYDAVQHMPVLRDAWVVSLHGRLETTFTDDDEQVPFFMLPALGGGSTLRGFASWRFRDRHSLLLQAEWRVLVNRFLDMAVFYDAGKVMARTKDAGFDGLKGDYGIGFRFHGPLSTPLRVEVARSNEGVALVFSSRAPF
jgi:hypothetical protein